MTNRQKQLFIQLVEEISGERVEHNEDVQNGIIQTIQGMAFQHRQEIAQMWVTKEDGSTYAIVEKAETGQVIPWSEDLDFLEPARQRVEVTPYGKPPITGYLVGWYQYQDEDQAGPVALVRHDDRTFDTYSPRQVQIIEEVPNGQ